MKTPRDSLFYLSTDGSDSAGPYTLKQIRAMWDSGSITAAAQLCHDGESWYPALTLMSKLEKIDSEAEAAKSNAPSRLVFTLLGLFLGMFGIHNFYGRGAANGVRQLILTLLGAALFSWGLYLGFLILVAVAIWVLVDLVRGPE